jgi:hypothetical protein
MFVKILLRGTHSSYHAPSHLPFIVLFLSSSSLLYTERDRASERPRERERRAEGRGASRPRARRRRDGATVPRVPPRLGHVLLLLQWLPPLSRGSRRLLFLLRAPLAVPGPRGAALRRGPARGCLRGARRGLPHHGRQAPHLHPAGVLGSARLFGVLLLVRVAPALPHLRRRQQDEEGARAPLLRFLQGCRQSRERRQGGGATAEAGHGG